MNNKVNYKLYHGNSVYLALRAVKNAISSNTEKQNLITIEADTQKAQQIIDSIQNQGLFVSKRVFLIKRLYKNKDKDSLIEKLLSLLNEQFPDDIYFLEDQKIRSTTKYLKFFKSNDSVEEYTQLNKRNFLSWLDQELKENDLKADETTKRLLAQRTNYDPERCSNEIKKHKLNNSEEIKESDLDILTTDTLEEDIWKLIDVINTEKKERSIEILEKLYSQNTDPNFILSMLARNLRLITMAKHLKKQKKSFAEICSIMKVAPFSLYPILGVIDRYDMHKIKLLYTKLSNLDYQIKNGQIDGMLGLTLICPYL